MICGIDPGRNGAIASLYPDGKLYVVDMPMFDKEVNAAALATLFREFPPRHTVIETVNSYGMGRQTAFNFGQGVGVLKGTIAALELPYSQVAPRIWKQHFHLKRDKTASRETATQLFPSYAIKFERKKDDGRAEAALIALWARQTGVGK